MKTIGKMSPQHQTMRPLGQRSHEAQEWEHTRPVAWCHEQGKQRHKQSTRKAHWEPLEITKESTKIRRDASKEEKTADGKSRVRCANVSIGDPGPRDKPATVHDGRRRMAESLSGLSGSANEMEATGYGIPAMMHLGKHTSAKSCGESKMRN